MIRFKLDYLTTDEGLSFRTASIPVNGALLRVVQVNTVDGLLYFDMEVVEGDEK